MIIFIYYLLFFLLFISQMMKDYRKKEVILLVISLMRIFKSNNHCYKLDLFILLKKLYQMNHYLILNNLQYHHL
jgi:hypothetical protein